VTPASDRRVRLVTVAVGVAGMLLTAMGTAAAQDISVNFGQGNGLTERVIQIALLTVLSLAPSILVMMTSFTRIVVVVVAAAHGTRYRDRAAECRNRIAGAVFNRIRDGAGAATRLRHRHQASGRLVDGWSLVAGSLIQSNGA
jgi:flagellar biosynthesis protein FliP